MEDFVDLAYFASFGAGWITKNIFVYYCLLLICQLSHYRLTLPEELQIERFLLIVDGHKSRENYLPALILYLFNIDLLLLPSHSSHILQPFDICVASSLKSFFKEELVADNCDIFMNGGYLVKQTSQQLNAHTRTNSITLQLRLLSILFYHNRETTM